jgi:hypothetical protein
LKQDDVNATEPVNVRQRVDEFVKLAQGFGASVAGNDVMVTMGGDFEWINAFIFFRCCGRSCYAWLTERASGVATARRALTGCCAHGASMLQPAVVIIIVGFWTLPLLVVAWDGLSFSSARPAASQSLRIIFSSARPLVCHGRFA